MYSKFHLAVAASLYTFGQIALLVVFGDDKRLLVSIASQFVSVVILVGIAWLPLSRSVGKTVNLSALDSLPKMTLPICFVGIVGAIGSAFVFPRGTFASNQVILDTVSIVGVSAALLPIVSIISDVCG